MVGDWTLRSYLTDNPEFLISERQRWPLDPISMDSTDVASSRDSTARENGNPTMTCSGLIGPHEGKELTLMLSGMKPLSLFYFESAGEGAREFPQDAFDEQVSLGRFVKRIASSTVLSPKGTPIKITTVLYSLSDETWRIDAYLFIAELYQSFGSGFRPDLERLIGSLLGYTAEEVDAFISHVRANGAYLAYG